MRNCAIVSAVPPDLDVTMKSVRGRCDSIQQRSDGVRIDVVENLQAGKSAALLLIQHVPAARRSAVRKAIGPSAEPPMPSITTSSYLPARGGRKARRLVEQRLSSLGSSRNPSRSRSFAAAPKPVVCRGELLAAPSSTSWRRSRRARSHHVGIVES